MSAWQEGRDRVLGQIGRIGLTGGIYDLRWTHTYKEALNSTIYIYNLHACRSCSLFLTHICRLRLSSLFISCDSVTRYHYSMYRRKLSRIFFKKCNTKIQGNIFTLTSNTDDRFCFAFLKKLSNGRTIFYGTVSRYWQKSMS